MESVVLVLFALACPLGMGLCMWMMARGMRGDSAKHESDEAKQPSLAKLRSEQERLATEIARVEHAAGNGTEAVPASDAPVQRAYLLERQTGIAQLQRHVRPSAGREPEPDERRQS